MKIKKGTLVVIKDFSDVRYVYDKMEDSKYYGGKYNIFAVHRILHAVTYYQVRAFGGRIKVKGYKCINLATDDVVYVHSRDIECVNLESYHQPYHVIPYIEDFTQLTLPHIKELCDSLTPISLMSNFDGSLMPVRNGSRYFIKQLTSPINK